MSASTAALKTVTEARLAALAARIYACGSREPLALVLHLHGGAFNCGSLDSGRPVAEVLCQAGATVASLDYPLAPAHRFPEALDAIFGALRALHAKRRAFAARTAPLHVAGEEAGGNLAAALAMVARDRGGPPLAGQILLSPMLDACLATHSLRSADAGPVGCRWADGWQAYLRGPEQAAHPYAAPLGASRLAGLPPALIVTAEDDPLRDECLGYAERLRGAGVRAELHIQPAPTAWPTAYAGDPSRAGESCCCLPAIRDRLTAFLRSTAPP